MIPYNKQTVAVNKLCQLCVLSFRVQVKEKNTKVVSFKWYSEVTGKLLRCKK